MSVQESNRAEALWKSVWLLLQLRFAIFTSGFRRSQRKGKIRLAILVIVIITLIGAAGYLSWKIFDFLQSPQLSALFQEQEELKPFFELLSSLPVVITSAVFVLLLLTSFGVMLQTLYLSNDLDFLLSLPIPTRAIFLAKMIQAVLPNLGIVYLFSLPVLFFLGIIWEFHPFYYVVVILLLAAYALAAGGLASLLVMAVVRIIPARRVAEVLGFLGAIISILCSQSGQFARFGEVSGSQAESLLNLASRVNLPWSPLSWAGRGLVALGNQEWLLAAGLLSIVFAGTIAAFFISLALSERLYYSGWASLQAVSSRKKPPRKKSLEDKVDEKVDQKSSIFIDKVFARILPVQIQGMVEKDSLMLRRDLRNLSQLVTPIIIGVIYTLLLFRGGEEPFAGRGDAPEMIQQGLRSITVFANVFISLFVSWTLLSRLAGMAFSLEGKYYWTIKSAPVSSTYQIISKFIVAYLPTLALSSLFLVIISVLRVGSLRLLPYTLPAVTLIIAGNCGLNLAFGIVGARMDWEDPRQMQRFWSGCLGSLVTFIYLPVSLVFFLGPVLLASILNYPEGLGWLAGLLIGGALSIIVAVAPLAIVKNRINLLGES